MDNVIDLLRERGFIESVTSDDLRHLADRSMKVYCGFDPTADSLHLGNFVAIMGLAWFQRCGHTPVALIGGATGMVGDPSGKEHERQLLDQKTIEKNLVGIKKNLQAVLDFEHPKVRPLMLNNYDWFKEFHLVSFLRDVGKHYRVGPMLARDSVRARLQSEEGMSFTEFTYQLLQGYDFLHLYDHHGVNVQLGGSDQWGNIVGGIDLIRKMRGATTYGATFPLLTTSSGQKFGKSEKGAIWLSPERLSPYEFYQYLIRVADADVIRLMRMLTFMPMEAVREWENKMQGSNYEPNSAQKCLAAEVTRIVHDDGCLQAALKAVQAVAPGSTAELDGGTLEAVAKDMPSCSLPMDEVAGIKLIDLMVHINLQASKGEARRLVRNGGAYINNKKVENVDIIITEDQLIDGSLLLLAAGKKNKMLVRIF